MRPQHKIQPGEQYGRLTVLRDSGGRSHGCVLWACRCACGTIVAVATDRLQQRTTRSCGCLRREVDERRGQGILARMSRPGTRLSHVKAGATNRAKALIRRMGL